MTAETPLDMNSVTANTLRDSKIRAEISPAAIRLFLKFADYWNLSIDQRLILLGDISRQTYHHWQQGKLASLSRDQLERVSLMLGIHKGLSLLFADEAAGIRWFKSSNRDLPFGGMSPLDRILHGSIDDLCAVRRYIDDWGNSP